MPMVEVRMRDDTLLQVDQLQNRVHAPSRSDALRRAVELTDVVTKAIQHGARVIIEEKDGRQVEVNVPGINE